MKMFCSRTQHIDLGHLVSHEDMQRRFVNYFLPELCTFQHLNCYGDEFLYNWCQVLHFSHVLHKQNLKRIETDICCPK